MDKVILDKNLSFIERVIKELPPMVGFSNPKEILWLVFGSYVINMNTTDSDIDIIGIHDSFIGKKRRITIYQNVPIHLTAITMSDLKDDGESRLYGGYFSGKIIKID